MPAFFHTTFLTPLVLALALQQPTQAPTAQQSDSAKKEASSDAVEKCSMTGKVVSAVDGNALKKATLMLMPQQGQTGIMTRPPSVSSDANGIFRFTEIPSGRYLLSVTRNGYARQNFGERIPGGPGTPISLLPGQNLKDIVVRMSPAASISGKIVDEDNEPIPSVSVQLMRFAYMRGKRQPMPVGFAQTDDRGQFRIFGVAAGRYYLSATYRDMFFGGPRSSDNSEAYAPTFYPGTNDISQATLISLHASDDQPGFNFRLLPGRAVKVSGTVRLSSGDPAKNAAIQVFPRGPAMIAMNNFQISDEKGTFSLGSILPGSYVLIAMETGNDDHRETGRADIEVSSEPLENVMIQMGTGNELEADVRLDGNVDLSKNTVRLMLTFEETIPMSTPFVELKDAGPTVLKRVFDGNYRLLVGGLPDDAYVSRAEYQGKDALAEGVKVRGGGDPLSITISADGAHLEGVVYDKEKKPFAGAQVALVPEESKRSRQDLFRTSSSDQYGRFMLKGIAPGSYTLFAWDAIESGAYMDPEFIKTYEDAGKTLVLSAGEHATSDVTVIVSNIKPN